MTQAQLTPALVILQQLGGKKFLAMTGSKNLFHCNEGKTLMMHLSPNKAKAKYLFITLNENDLYDMEFCKLNKELERVILHELKNVYAEDLQDNFTQITGLDTHL